MTLPDYYIIIIYYIIILTTSQGSRPARPAEPGTLKASLEITPAIASLTEGVVFHYYHNYYKDNHQHHQHHQRHGNQNLHHHHHHHHQCFMMTKYECCPPWREKYIITITLSAMIMIISADNDNQHDAKGERPPKREADGEAETWRGRWRRGGGRRGG